MSDYRPIDCQTYGEFERAIVRHQRLRISWCEPDGQAHLETLTPYDLETCEGEEFLLARNADGAMFRLRLDRIKRATVIPPSVTQIRFPNR